MRIGTLLLLQIVALWPVWVWYGARLDEPAETLLPAALALATAAVMLWSRRAARHRPDARAFALPALTMLLYAGSFPYLPALLRAALGVLALSLTLSPIFFGRALAPGLLGLGWLALPLLPSLQFYLGHPLRVISGSVAAAFLRFGGWPVVREGTVLTGTGEPVWIDAPCSGVRMLWFGLYLAFALHVIGNRGYRAFGFHVSSALAACLIANAVRAAALYQVTTSGWPAPEWMHEALGVLTFALAAGFLARMALSRQGGLPCTASS